jgi:hypothetical protein
VIEIGELAFDSCSSLTSMIVQTPTPPKYILKNADECRIDLYVPKGSINAYSASKPWGEFRNIKEIPDDFEGTLGIIEDIPDVSKGTTGNRGLWGAVCIISALVLFVAVFVVIKRM